jgi:hypothetical protein
MQVCNTTWAKNMTTGSPVLEALVAKINTMEARANTMEAKANTMEAKANTMEAKANIMGDIITSMIMLLENMTDQQLRLNLTVDHLSTAASQTNTQINPPTFTNPTGSTPPANAAAACATWNKTESAHDVVYFTVKNLDKSPTPCNNAIADAFIAQVRAAAAVRLAVAPAAADPPAEAPFSSRPRPGSSECARQALVCPWAASLPTTSTKQASNPRLAVEGRLQCQHRRCVSQRRRAQDWPHQ